MKYTVHVGNIPITLEHENIDEKINVDDLTKIDVGNIFGEMVTAAAAANRIGMLKAEVEETMNNLKLDIRLKENILRLEKRKQAAENSGFFFLRVENEDVKVKLTEKALETVHESDADWIEMKRSMIKAERNIGLLTALYWAVQEKARNVGRITGNVTPSEFIGELIEGVVNGILIKK